MRAGCVHGLGTFEAMATTAALEINADAEQLL
jgi:hypothetical protein